MAVTSVPAAVRGRVAVFAAIGGNARPAIERLRLDPGIGLAASPRHAAVLLVAGDIPEADRAALRLLHDQVPRPRATLWWGARPFDELAAPLTLALHEDPAALLRQLQRELRSGARPSEPDLLPDEPPAPWRGVGPHGQGGQGMMGGKPYGRPMAMTAEDLRDGLMLDAFQVRIGPFWPSMPPGLLLELTLQGDVIQQARVLRAPEPPASPGVQARPEACARLEAVAGLLDVLQLSGPAQRCRRLAQQAACGTPVDFGALRRRLRLAGVFAAIPPELGRHADPQAGSGTVRDRLRRWLDDAPAASTDHHGHESPAHLADLADLLRGLEWSEAMLVIHSFTPAELCRVAPPDAGVGTEPPP